MSCGCKDKNVNNNPKEVKEGTINNSTFSKSIFVKIVIFVIAIVALLMTLIPIILPMLIIMLFNRIVLNKGTDVTKPIIKAGKMMSSKKNINKKKSINEEEFEGEEKINPDDYELEDVEVMK